jgi:hypothetical protein
VKICGGYIQEVKDARDEILELQQAVTDITGVLRELKVLFKILKARNSPALGP